MSRSNILRLYKDLLRESSKFAEFNYREYARRRIKDGFRANISTTDKSQIEKLLKSAQSNLEVIKRQVVVGNLYKDSTLVIENSLKKKNP